MHSNEKPNRGFAIVANSSWLNGKRFDIGEGTLTIGRSTQADITLPSNHLSRQHAQLRRSGNELVLQDMASMNGTFVNGRRVKTVPIKPGDQLRFDTFTFVVEGPGERRAKSAKKAKQRLSGAKIGQRKKSTSPGNRPQPSPGTSAWGRKLATAGLVAVCLLYLIYLAFFS